MKRIAIIGGGISGLTAAYELELARQRGAAIDWHLYEASNRLGGIIETTRHSTPEGEFILEGGPDGWVTEKPWARELAIELGLESELIYSNDATRKTYILTSESGTAHKLQPIPDRMRLMVPEDLSALDNSPLFSQSAKQAYANELTRAAELKSTTPAQDESVADFVRRHFGDEVLNTLAAPLLSGVFGGDVHKLSVRAVMPQFVAMEREHGSLILALQQRRNGPGQRPPIFTSFRRGMASLTDAIIAALPPERVHLHQCAYDVDLDVEEWYVDLMPPQDRTMWRRLTTVIPYWNDVVLATPLNESRRLLHELDPRGSAVIRSDSSFLALTPSEASSAILASFAWPADLTRTFVVPSGFGFLVPPKTLSSRPETLSEPQANRIGRSGETPVFRAAQRDAEPALLACTFVDQKFPHRAPPGARILRAFFGGPSVEALNSQSDEIIAAAALTQLRNILGPIPKPTFHTVRRWPHSLPQYEVGHLDRIAELERLIQQTPGLHLLGNSHRGVGLPDLIRDARATARAIAEGL
jgi:oxygen-dependent protoporphyrinogen oxidase